MLRCLVQGAASPFPLLEELMATHVLMSSTPLRGEVVCAQYMLGMTRFEDRIDIS